MSVAELINSAKQLEAGSFEQLYRDLTVLRIQRQGHAVVDEQQADLLASINTEFPLHQLERLRYLDWKMEFGALTEAEETESIELAEAYERYTVNRLKALSTLATLRQTTLDALMEQLGIAHS